MKNIINSVRKTGKRRAAWLAAAALALALAGLTLAFLYLRLPEKATFLSPHPHEQKVSVEIAKIRRIRQPFDGQRAGLTGVSLKMQAPTDQMGKLKGRLRFQLADAGGKILEDQTLPAAALADFGSFTFSFPPLADSAGAEYTVTLTALPEAQPAGEAATLNLYICGGAGTLDYLGAPAGRALVADGVYTTTRIGSLYNGRMDAGSVTRMIILCVVSVLLLSALTVLLLSCFQFLPENGGGGHGTRPGFGKE